MERSPLATLMNGLHPLKPGWDPVKSAGEMLKSDVSRSFYGSFSFTKAHFLLDASVWFLMPRPVPLVLPSSESWNFARSPRILRPTRAKNRHADSVEPFPRFSGRLRERYLNGFSFKKNYQLRQQAHSSHTLATRTAPNKHKLTT